jgi:uncharacterized protein (UPF0332 family)
MKASERDEYVKYRIEKSEETYEVAELLVENKKWNSAINQLYYAAYYAVSGLLATLETETKTHTGVKTQFFMNYIKTGKIEIRLGKLYADLFDWRQKGDYGDFFDFGEGDVMPLMAPARELIDAVKREIENKK